MVGNIYNHKLEDALFLTNPDSVEQTVANIKRQAARGAAPFNYNKARLIAKLALSGSITEDQVRLACLQKNANGTKSNTDAAMLLREQAATLRVEPVMCHDFEKKYFYQVRHDIAFPVNVPFFFAQQGKVFLPWIQYRKTFSYTNNHWGLLKVLLQDVYGDDFDEGTLNFIFLDLCAPENSPAREFRLFEAGDLPHFDKDYLTHFFSVYAAAYDICVRDGVQKAKPKTKPKAQEKTYDLFS